MPEEAKALGLLALSDQMRGGLLGAGADPGLHRPERADSWCRGCRD